MPAHAFRAKLNRRERVLDFVREPPGDVAPGRHTLRPDQRRHVVEHEHRASDAAVVADQRRTGGRQVELAPFPQEGDLLRRRRRCARASLREERLQRREILTREDGFHARADDRPIDVEQPQRRAVDRLDLPFRIERDDARGDALEDRLDVLAALVELQVLPLEIQARVFELPLARRQLAGHRVERLDELPELVARLGLDAVVEMPGANLPCAGSQQLHGPRNPLREIQARPDRADQNHQRHDDEQVQVDAANRPPQRVELAAILIGLDDPSRVPRGLSRQMIAGQHHADDAAARVAHRRAGANELTAAVQRFRRVPLGRPHRDERGLAIRGRLHAASRRPGHFDGEHRDDLWRLARPSRPIDFDEPHASLCHLRLDRAPQRHQISGLQRAYGNVARDARGVVRHAGLAIAVVVLRDARRRVENVVDRLAEPLLGAAADQPAPDDQHEHARHHGQTEQGQHELRAKPRERQTASPLDHELHDVAREHEDERDEHRQIGGRERVDEEVGVELRRPIREADHRHETRDEHEDAEKDQPRVVAERAAL